MGWKDALLAPLLKPTVVHRLPGRLRVHIPLLRRIPENRPQITGLIESLLAAPAEIERVSVCRVTGNVLLCYDAESADEERVLQLLHKLTGLATRYGKTLATMCPDSLATGQDRLAQFIEMNQGNPLDVFLDFEVPANAVA
jgi:hypothetical protein